VTNPVSRLRHPPKIRQDHPAKKDRLFLFGLRPLLFRLRPRLRRHRLEQVARDTAKHLARLLVFEIDLLWMFIRQPLVLSDKSDRRYDILRPRLLLTGVALTCGLREPNLLIHFKENRRLLVCPCRCHDNTHPSKTF